MVNALSMATMLLVTPTLAAAAGLRGGRALTGSRPPAGPTDMDVAIANFALNLECLEAEFYSWAAYGYGLSDELRGGGPEPIGGMKANLSAVTQAYADELARNEVAHVAVLRAALGDAAVPCPQIDIGPAFAAAANAATNVTLSPPYTPYFNDAWFLLGAFIFEDVGVTAYHGAAPLIADKGILGTAAGILAVEAYHGGSVRTLLYQQEDTMLTPYPLTVKQATDAVSALRAKVGGGKDKPIVTADGQSQIVPADENKVAFARTADEVLAIVYLGDATKPGGFFPNGINA